jgi:hypothetical protein
MPRLKPANRRGYFGPLPFSRLYGERFFLMRGTGAITGITKFRS